MRSPAIAAGTVHEVLARYMLVDGPHLVVDLERSRGARIREASTGEEYLDFFGSYSTSALGFNHPALREPEFLAELVSAAVNKITNSDLYSESLARFVATFASTLPETLSRHLFFIEGGALAVENALKAAFDWKRRLNIAAGRAAAGSQVIHFRDAFHGRSGYTLSLTNTDRVKIEHFPKFSWPRVTNPALTFPIDDQVLEAVRRAEGQSLAEIQRAIVENPHDIAALIIEPIQAEGGDHHFRPEFLRRLREIADESELLLIFDEVQTGFGTTGRWWCFEHFGVEPDIVAFGKKTQVCGIAASARLDLVDSVFEVPSRINSTWGGHLADMVRCRRQIEVIREQRLFDNVVAVGQRLLNGLQRLSERLPALVSNPRGSGFFLAFDLPDATVRDLVLRRLRDVRLLALPTGRRGIRFRPPLILSEREADEGLELCERALRTV
ncbi:MAG TPA: L-lysine 6-transaminase [Thermoanaerobaculia bacterium]|nr:L-lysine 6-transaminase [Thermoanaerobaculia bacterium]